MLVTIAKVNKIFFKGKTNAVICPATEGEVTILPGHTPLITALKEGKVTVKTTEGEEKIFPIQFGILEVNKNETIILL